MLSVHQNVLAKFNDLLHQRAVPESFQPHYRKWVRYFLDFCRKYPPPDAKSEQVRLFIDSNHAGPRRCENDDDLYALRTEQNRERGEESTGLLKQA
jgi:hypothetical protein